jgi:uncharacterized membrane protein
MRVALAILLLIHAFIHLAGLLKAFGFAELHQLTIPISKQFGVAWIVAMLALLVSPTLACNSVAPHSDGTDHHVVVVSADVAVSSVMVEE